jgi:hypothetical protein
MGEPYIDRALIEGRIVHYNFGGICRAAIVVRNWGGPEPSAVNLHVFLDGGNDRSLIDPRSGGVVNQDGWVTSVIGGPNPGQYHDPRTCPNVSPTTG